MNKQFSNIIIFNDKTIDSIIEKIEKIMLGLNYKKSDKDESKIQIDIVQDIQNNICVVSSDYFKFENLSKNKSIIRKISKRVAQDTFMVTAIDDIAVIEKYSFNKRIYDYICFGNKEKLEILGYNESYAKYMKNTVWSNHFVGRNTLDSLEKILKEKDTYFENYELLLDIMKLYGIKIELTSYRCSDNIQNHEIIKSTLFFK